jgi:hypothetical protein
MRTLTIEAASPESACALYRAVSGFLAEIVENDDGTSSVTITLSGADGEIAAVLAAIQRHVTERSTGPAVIGLDGTRYTLEPEQHTPSDGALRQRSRRQSGRPQLDDR